MIGRLIAYLRGLARRRRISDEVDDELRFHLEHEAAAHVARGVPPDEARRMALRDLGGLLRTREAVRDVRMIWLDILSRDLRHAVRALRATPAFTGAALTILTLSIGASTAIFSVVDAVVLRDLAFEEDQRLVAIAERRIDGSPDWRDGTWQDAAAPQNFLDWRERQDVFTGLAAVVYGELTLQREGDSLPEHVLVPAVSADFFTVLRTPPLLGRTFTADDEREAAARVAVISYDFWQRRFGGRTDIIGARLPGAAQNRPAGGARTFEIVGVMPPEFVYPVDLAEPASAWVPYIPSPADRIRGNSFGYNLHVIGRLRDGVSPRQAQARMDQITATLAAETPRWFTDRVAKVEPLRQFLTGGVRLWMLMLLAAVSFVVLIACVNVANLMLVRGTTRVRELGIRTAVGASRWDLSRMLLLESLVLSLAGAALGTIVAAWGVDILRAAMPPEVPRVAMIAVDMRVLGATALVAILTGAASSLAPVLYFSRPVAAGLIRSERVGRGGARMPSIRAALVVAEVALAVVLLVGSGLFLASFARVVNVDLGFDRRDVLTVRVRVLEVPKDPQQFTQRNRQLLLNVLDRVRRMPGVEAAALLGQGLPLRGDLQTVNIAIPGRVLPEGARDIAFNQISPDYFTAIRTPLLKGRFFTEADSGNGEPVVILNEEAAARYFPGEDPIGRVVRVAGARTVVGVVGNVRHEGPEGGWRTQAFVPVTQSAVAGATLVVRRTPDAVELVPGVRDAIWSEFPDAEIPTQIDVRLLDEYFDGLVAQRKLNMLLLTLFGVLGLCIATVGIYGVLSYVVTQRTQEIGIRLALGAVPSLILRSVLARAALYVALGLGIGVAGAWGLAALVEGFLFQIRPHDPAVYAAVLFVLTSAGLGAAMLPARRAGQVNPLVAIRAE